MVTHSLSTAPRPYPKQTRIASPETIQAARDRDGACLYCLKFGGGVPGYDVHHIHSRGSGGGDVPENLICLCRKHHNMAHNGIITRDDLKGLLRNMYGYV